MPFPGQRIATELLDGTGGEIDRLNGIVERLLYFSRPLNLRNSKPFDLVLLLKDCVDAKAALVRSESIRFLFDATNTTAIIRGGPFQSLSSIRQLLSNAIDALGPVGTVELKVLDKDGYVTVECSDDGHGIPEEIRDKLFDPFFTTRPKGIGLGLSITYEIDFALMRGTIEISSSPKQRYDCYGAPAAGPGTSGSGAETIEIENA